MTDIMRFPHAHALAELETDAALPAWLEPISAGFVEPAPIVVALLSTVLHARKASLQAAFDTALAADELRRYQKFAKPGKPSPHIVQLRQKQAAARQATNVARQSLIKAAAAFVRAAGLSVPARITLDVHIAEWIDAHVPRDAA